MLAGIIRKKLAISLQSCAQTEAQESALGIARVHVGCNVNKKKEVVRGVRTVRTATERGRYK
jgi:hypothetical protein